MLPKQRNTKSITGALDVTDFYMDSRKDIPEASKTFPEEYTSPVGTGFWNPGMACKDMDLDTGSCGSSRWFVVAH